MCSSDLVALWRFDEGSGLVTSDSSGNGNAGRLDALAYDNDLGDYVADSDYAPMWVAGKSGSALDFDPSFDEERGGTTPYSRPMVFVETNGQEGVDNGALNLTGSFTMAMWLSFDSVNGDGTGGLRAPNWPTLLAKPGCYIVNPPKAGSEQDFYLWDNPGEPGLEAQLLANAAPPLEQWVHLAFVYDLPSETLTLYVDGVAQSAAPAWNTTTRSYPASPWDLFIGHYPFPGEGVYERSFSGKMDDVALFDNALAPIQIAAVKAGNFSEWGVANPPPAVTIHPLGMIISGMRVELTAPEGSAYTWLKEELPIDGAPPRVTGINSRTLVLDPVEITDSGSYSCTFDDGSKAMVTTEVFELNVIDAADVPAVGLLAMATLAAAIASCGLRKLIRRY